MIDKLLNILCTDVDLRVKAKINGRVERMRSEFQWMLDNGKEHAAHALTSLGQDGINCAIILNSYYLHVIGPLATITSHSTRIGLVDSVPIIYGKTIFDVKFKITGQLLVDDFLKIVMLFNNNDRFLYSATLKDMLYTFYSEVDTNDLGE